MLVNIKKSTGITCNKNKKTQRLFALS